MSDATNAAIPLTPLRSGGGVDRALGQAKGLLAQPAVRRAMPFLIGLLAVAAVAMLYMTVRSADYRPLFPNLAEEDKAAVVEALVAANFDAQVDPATGAVEVPAADYHKARMLLAGQGLPKAAAAGYDLLNDMPMGSSRALETARLKQSQESELARSVAEISGVEAARVHLALPEQSVFVRERTPPSASVFLKLSPGRALGEAQVRSIVHLVSSSVPNLAADNVSVVDQSGTLLTADANGGDGLGESQRRVAYQSKLEDMYRQRLVSLLTPLVGPDNFTAEVHLDLDFTMREATREAYDKANAVVRQEQTAMQQMAGTAEGGTPRGIPGALSNLPPPAATIVEPGQEGAAPTAPAAAAPVPAGPRSENVERSYDVGKEISVTRTVAGDIRRATVAVVLREQPGKPVTKAELAAIDQLVRGAVGVDARRGDVVAITARPFNQTIEPTPEPWYKADWVDAQSRNLALVLVGAMLVFGVLRPLAKRVLAKSAEGAVNQVQLTPGMIQEAIDAGELRGRTRRTSIPPELLTSAKDYDEKVALVRMFVADDTGRASNVLKSMMRADAPQAAAGTVNE